MRILIAHQSAIERRRLCSRLNDCMHVRVDRIVTDLSQTYDYAEHHHPDCVVLSLELVDCSEFELLDALLRVLRIGCVVIGQPSEVDNLLLSSDASLHIVRLRPNPNLDELSAAIERACTTARSQETRIVKTKSDHGFDGRRLILLGASTGGVDALLNVIKFFPHDCPPTLIVQHTGGQFSRSLIRLLDGGTSAKVSAATHGEIIRPGHIYLAPDDSCHLQVQTGPNIKIALRSEESASGHRPSIDKLFQSATHLAPNVTAAILTGMGRDGAAGITALREAGATTIGQDEATSIVYGMPRIARELGGIMHQLPIEKIGPAILKSSQIRSHV